MEEGIVSCFKKHLKGDWLVTFFPSIGVLCYVNLPKSLLLHLGFYCGEDIAVWCQDAFFFFFLSIMHVTSWQHEIIFFTLKNAIVNKLSFNGTEL